MVLMKWAWPTTTLASAGLMISIVLSCIVDAPRFEAYDDKQADAPPKARRAEGRVAIKVAERPWAASLPAYFSRLSQRAQRIYLTSDSIERFDLVPSPAAGRTLESLMSALAANDT